MIIHIPTHRLVPNEVPASLERYGHEVRAFTATYSKNRYIDIGIKRTAICRDAENMKGKYVCMSDSLIVHMQDNIFDMCLFLDNNPAWGGIALDRRHEREDTEPYHVALSCCMFRTEIDLDFIPEPGDCECIAITKTLRPKWKFGYLEGKGRIKQLPKAMN